MDLATNQRANILGEGQAEQAFLLPCLKHNQKQTYKIFEYPFHLQDLDQIQLFSSVIMKSLPNMAKQYIIQMIFDRKHKSLLAIKGQQIIGGICFRIFKKKSFAELVFLAIKEQKQRSGYGTRIINVFKDFLNQKSINTIITFADNLALSFFKKCGFSKVNTQTKDYEGFVVEYQGGTMMKCSISRRIPYLYQNQTIQNIKKSLYQQINKTCLSKIRLHTNLTELVQLKRMNSNKKSFESWISQLKGFNGFSEWNQLITTNSKAFQTTILDECLQLIYGILGHHQTKNLSTTLKIFDEKYSKNQSKDFKTFEQIWKFVQQQKYQKVDEFAKDLQTYLSKVQSFCFDQKCLASLQQLKKYVNLKISNLKNLEQSLSAPQDYSITIQN